MKKVWVILTSLLLVLALAGCGASEKAQEKAAEKALEDALGDDVNVDIDGDKYVYEDKDGNKIEVGGSEWPTGETAKLIPKFDTGTIVSVVEMENSCIIDIDEVEKSDFETYFQKIKDAGFAQDPYEVKDESGIMYMANTENGNAIVLGYTVEEKHMQISITAAQ